MRILTGVSLILGCFLGAGFVSGREVACYFSQYGSISFISCIFAGILLFILLMLFFKVSNNVNNCDMFIRVYFSKCSMIINCLFSLSILIISGSMIAGTYSLANSLHFSPLIVTGLTLCITFFVVKNNVLGMSKVNNILVPCLIIVLLITTLVDGGDIIRDESNIINVFFSGSSYVFINIVSLGLLTIEIGGNYSKKEKLYISLISSIIIIALLLIVNRAILCSSGVNEAMPNLELSKRNVFLYIAMQICIYFGLLTTLVSNIYLLSRFIKKHLKSDTFAILTSLVLSTIVSLVGFENIVGYIYLIIAVIGVLVVCASFRCKKKSVY